MLDEGPEAPEVGEEHEAVVVDVVEALEVEVHTEVEVAMMTTAMATRKVVPVEAVVGVYAEALSQVEDGVKLVGPEEDAEELSEEVHPLPLGENVRQMMVRST